MLDKFKFIFKDFKKASKYAQIYDYNIKNAAIHNDIRIKTYVWVEKIKYSNIEAC